MQLCTYKLLNLIVYKSALDWQMAGGYKLFSQ